MNDWAYILDNTLANINRLTLQAEIFEPMTRRLLDNAGLGEGMRVLDLGCGAGDVTLLAAERVGPSGLVVGIDRDARSHDAANERARRCGYLHGASAKGC